MKTLKCTSSKTWQSIGINSKCIFTPYLLPIDTAKFEGKKINNILLITNY